MTLRKGHIWTASKLDFLEEYLPAFQLACQAFWRSGHSNTYYVDGFAGPGQNTINSQIRAGSPLIAAHITPPFKHYFLVEAKMAAHAQLLQNLGEPGLAAVRPQIDVRRGNFNQEVDSILAQLRGGLPAFFFLDPEGLELEWETVRKIGQRARADLFILISGSGVLRCSAPSMPGHHDSVTRFYGHERWRQVLHGEALDTASQAGKKRFETAVELYVEGLTGLGFTHVDQFLIATNSRNADLHALVFASKNGTAVKIARHVLKKLDKNRRGDQQPLFPG
ncbi:three-Cys-motif partner protein TcmP [Deinococcus aestuarii]|uniref:three-Cys-motif partner protein TcmP n=1 Tax=Deinococcus aestuarii TaxID=2774531 RepID=UPI001C0E6F61|nr:three-Cys-motif partner protein TcmP [Deinococcus aestuarii]